MGKVLYDVNGNLIGSPTKKLVELDLGTQMLIRGGKLSEALSRHFRNETSFQEDILFIAECIKKDRMKAVLTESDELSVIDSIMESYNVGNGRPEYYFSVNEANPARYVVDGDEDMSVQDIISKRINDHIDGYRKELDEYEKAKERFDDDDEDEDDDDIETSKSSSDKKEEKKEIPKDAVGKAKHAGKWLANLIYKALSLKSKNIEATNKLRFKLLRMAIAAIVIGGSVIIPSALVTKLIASIVATAIAAGYSHARLIKTKDALEAQAEDLEEKIRQEDDSTVKKEMIALHKSLNRQISNIDTKLQKKKERFSNKDDKGW